MSDLPIDLGEDLAQRLAAILDLEGKIPRALEALGPVAERDVLLVGGGPRRARQLAELGARVVEVDRVASAASAVLPVPDESADVLVSFWSAFRGVDPVELAEAERAIRQGGRMLAVHDYGRDDVARLLGDRPENDAWGRRDGPFLTGGWKVRILHCWWTFEGLPEAAEFLTTAFGEAGAALATELRRPRLAYKVAVYHRTVPTRDNVA